MAIQCDQCGHAAPDGARFCSECGVALPTPSVSLAKPADDADTSWVDLAGDSDKTTLLPPSSIDPVEPPAEPDPEAPPVPLSAEPPSPASLSPAPPLPDLSPPVAEEPPPVDPAPARANRLIWLIVILIGLVAATAIVVWALDWTRTATTAEVAEGEGSDDPPAPGVEDWKAAYRDSFLDPAEFTLVTSAEARQRDFPTADSSRIQRTIPANTEVTGRWVRGRDPATRWLRLATGGYVWDGNLARPGGPGSPITISFTNANEDFGTEIESYLDRLRAQDRARFERLDRLPKEEREAAMNDIEGQSTYLRIPERRWRGLTVTAVAQHYESHGIYFAQGPAEVRRALAAAGIEVDSTGGIPLPNEEAITCGIGATQGSDAAAYGATYWTCGV